MISASTTTIGDSENEVSISYAPRAGAHTIRVLNQVSVDVLLVHQSKMMGFNLVTRNDVELDGIPRSVKRLILRDLGSI